MKGIITISLLGPILEETVLRGCLLPLIARAVGNPMAIGISAGLFVAALAVASTIVDVSPFSTNGALMLANRPDTIAEPVYYKQILTYSMIVVAAGPLLVWAALVAPGW